MKREYEKENKSKSERGQNLSQLKFPKLTISKFEDTHLGRDLESVWVWNRSRWVHTVH